MLLQYPYGQQYLFTALESSPGLIELALYGLTDLEADFRPDPLRFTIREALAHLADWEAVFLERLKQMQVEDCPALPFYDKDLWAIEHRYAHADWRGQAEVFAERRQHLTAFLHTVPQEGWQRTGDLSRIGRLNIQELAMLIPLHDIYHLRQISDWRGKWRTQ